jgi:excisionase family DNA binding protein
MMPAPQPHNNPRRITPRLVGTIRDTAKQLGVTELTVRRQIKAGKLRAVQIGSCWRIPSATPEKLQELPLECTLHQVANSLDVSDLTVRRWIKAQQLPATKRNRAWVVMRSDLEALLVTGTPRRAAAASSPRVVTTARDHPTDRPEAPLNSTSLHHSASLTRLPV